MRSRPVPPCIAFPRKLVCDGLCRHGEIFERLGHPVDDTPSAVAVVNVFRLHDGGAEKPVKEVCEALYSRVGLRSAGAHFGKEGGSVVVDGHRK